MPNDVEAFGLRRRHKVSRNRIEDAFRDIAPIEPLWPGLVPNAQARFAEVVGRIDAVQFMEGFGVSACRLVNKLARPLSTRTKLAPAAMARLLNKIIAASGADVNAFQKSGHRNGENGVGK